MLKILSFIAEYWFVVLWLVGVVVSYKINGWRFALAVATLGIGSIAYRTGRKHEREEIREITRDIQERRENAYQEISDRNTSRNDVVDRLRDGNY